MSSPAQPAAPKPVSTWRKVFAAILDFIFIFAISGYVVASITGNTTESGFDLKGGRAGLHRVCHHHSLFYSIHAVPGRDNLPTPAAGAVTTLRASGGR
jgi:hypothetical protein